MYSCLPQQALLACPSPPPLLAYSFCCLLGYCICICGSVSAFVVAHLMPLQLPALQPPLLAPLLTFALTSSSSAFAFACFCLFIRLSFLSCFSFVFFLPFFAPLPHHLHVTQHIVLVLVELSLSASGCFLTLLLYKNFVNLRVAA